MSEMNSDKEISNESLAAPSSQNSSTLTQTSRLNKNDDQNKQRKGNIYINEKIVIYACNLHYLTHFLF